MLPEIGREQLRSTLERYLQDARYGIVTAVVVNYQKSCVIAKAAMDRGAPIVAVVTKPFA